MLYYSTFSLRFNLHEFILSVFFSSNYLKHNSITVLKMIFITFHNDIFSWDISFIRFLRLIVNLVILAVAFYSQTFYLSQYLILNYSALIIFLFINSQIYHPSFFVAKHYLRCFQFHHLLSFVLFPTFYISHIFSMNFYFNVNPLRLIVHLVT